jgi:hypothetical protein
MGFEKMQGRGLSHPLDVVIGVLLTRGWSAVSAGCFQMVESGYPM